MRIHKALVLLAAVAVLALGTAANDDPITIGFVDIDQAISSTEEGKAAREEFARKQREAEAQLKPMIERYQEAEEDLKAKKFVLSDEALFQRRLDMAELQNEIQSKMKELEGKLQVDQRRLEAPLVAKLNEIIVKIGKEEGFSMILRRGGPGILYAREALDITDLVIEQYNSKKG